MSSSAVRTRIINFLTSESAETHIIDLTGEIEDIDDLLARQSVPRQDGWLGVTFVGDIIEPRSLSATNTSGCYREFGAVLLHVVERGRIGVRDVILPRATALDILFRGRNISDLRVQNITPPNFESGATLDFEGGFVSATINIAYEYDFNL